MGKLKHLLTITNEPRVCTDWFHLNSIDCDKCSWRIVVCLFGGNSQPILFHFLPMRVINKYLTNSQMGDSRPLYVKQKQVN